MGYKSEAEEARARVEEKDEKRIRKKGRGGGGKGGEEGKKGEKYIENKYWTNKIIDTSVCWLCWMFPR